MATKSITKEEFEQGIKQLTESASKVYNVPQAEVEEYLKQRNAIIDNYEKEVSYWERACELKDALTVHYSKSMIRSENFDKIYLYSVERPNDYGKSKKYDEAIQTFKTNPNEAIKRGVTNDKGEPLDQVGYNKGKPMNKDDIWTKTAYGSVEIDGKLVPCKINLRRQAVNFDIDGFTTISLSNVILNNTKAEDKAEIENDPHKNWKKRMVTLTTTDETEFKQVGFFDIDKHIVTGPLKSFTEETFQSVVDKRNNKDYDVFFVQQVQLKIASKNDNLTTLNVYPKKDTNTRDRDEVFGVAPEDSPDGKVYTGFYNGVAKIQNDVPAWIIGTSYIKKQDKEMALNISGIWVDEINRSIEPKDGVKDEIKQVVSESKKETPKKEEKVAPAKKEEATKTPEKEDESFDDW